MNQEQKHELLVTLQGFASIAALVALKADSYETLDSWIAAKSKEVVDSFSGFMEGK